MGLKSLFDKEKRSELVHKVRTSETLRKASRGLSKASEVAAIVNKLQGTATLKNYLSVSTMVIHKIVSEGYYSHNPYDSEGARNIYVGGLEHHLFNICADLGVLEEDEEYRYEAFLATLGDRKIAFIGDDHEIFFVYDQQILDEESEDRREELIQAGVQDIHKYLSHVIWKKYGSTIEIFQEEDGKLGIRPWDSGQIKESDQATQLLNRLQKFFDRGEQRSVLLYGPPGTGKSSMVRNITQKLEWRTVFLDLSNQNRMTGSKLSFYLNFLHPSAVIVDDIDRIGDVSELLSSIDRIRETVRLFFATANDFASFDAALVRAGRFDETIEVTRIFFAEDYLPDNYPAEVLERVREWPISFLEELRIRAETLGMEDIMKEVEDLEPRVKNNVVKIGHASARAYKNAKAERY